ncbi:ArsC/Spx/MgsR family protein [Halioxenophilus sp. WMMB6]|uniref:ArsC/Spx/MgsR family protein n=1 Tax=Halioxenophilus sp. WMMB6 TaxID=3073815 RepID=UPI00295F1DC0|nr:ArsC/Spx/MgsR family protein [Halioxenophilus sp. WMMB6]
MLYDDIPLFFGKPTCINNRKQRQILHAAGVEFIEQDLLNYRWSTELLRQFFSGLPVAEWINKSAPQFKSGELDPSAMSPEQLLQAMVANPILIRRPLLAWRGQRWVGFDWQKLHQILPVNIEQADALLKADDDIESCARTQTAKG